MIKNTLKNILIAVTLTSSVVSFASEEVVVSKKYKETGERFYDETNRGYFAYEDLPSYIKKLEDRIKQLEASQPPKPKPLSAEWIKNALPKLLQKSLDNPTESNVLSYQLLEKVMKSKATAFAEMSSVVSIKYTVLDPKGGSPDGNSNSLAKDFYTKMAKKDALKTLAKKRMYWMFYKEACVDCITQSNIMHRMEELYGIETVAISINNKALENGMYPKFLNSNGMDASLQVRNFPAVYLADPETLEVTNIAQGLILQDLLLDRTVLMAKEMGWMSEDEFNLTSFRNRQFKLKNTELTEEDTKDVDKFNEKLISILSGE